MNNLKGKLKCIRIKSINNYGNNKETKMENYNKENKLTGHERIGIRKERGCYFYPFEMHLDLIYIPAKIRVHPIKMW